MDIGDDGALASPTAVAETQNHGGDTDISKGHEVVGTLEHDVKLI
jgi:hypothetical protein